MLTGKQVDNILVGGPADLFNAQVGEENKRLRKGDIIKKVCSRVR